MPYKDPKKQREAQARYFQENKERLVTNQRDRRNKKRRFLADLKDQPCTDCGIKYPPYVMDFDHVSGEKRFNLGSNLSLIPSMDALLTEVAKCEVVCANCHRHRTWMRSTERTRMVSSLP